MKARFLHKLQKLRNFLSDRVVILLVLSAFVGLFLFVIESSFVFIIQGFLFSLGILDASKLSVPAWYPTSFAASIVLLLSFGAGRGIAFFLKAYVAGLIQQAFIRLQRSRILTFGLENAAEVSSHEVLNLFSDRVVQAGAVMCVLAQILLMSTSAVLLTVLGFTLAPMEMLAGLLLLLVALFPLRFINYRIRESANGLVEESEASFRLLLQGMRHNFFLRVYRLVGAEVDKGLATLTRAERHYAKYYQVYAFKGALPLFLGLLIICAISYLSVTYVHTPPTKLLGFFYIFVRLAQTVGEINTALSEVRLNVPGFQMLYRWHERFSPPGGFNSDNVHSNDSQIGKEAFLADLRENGVRISAQNLGFSFEPSTFLFRGLSFDLKRGDAFVIQGKSGSGKSTLLTLILGLREPSAGTVLVNGRPISKVGSWLATEIAYVGPEPFLVQGTVRENLVYGHPDPSKLSDEEMWKALSQAQLTEDIRALSGKLNEPLFEAAQLSTGQRQRLAIARGLLRRPKLFILDEASANLDASTEADFVHSLRLILKDLTVIVISHKDSFNELATQRLNLGENNGNRT